MDAKARARGKLEDESIDADFRSGVYLGTGCIYIIFSMMPGNVIDIAGFLGYKGDRTAGLEYLQKSGGWSSDPTKPPIPKGSLTLRPCILVLIQAQNVRVSEGRCPTCFCWFSTWFFPNLLSMESTSTWPKGSSIGISGDVQMVRGLCQGHPLRIINLMRQAYFSYLPRAG